MNKIMYTPAPWSARNDNFDTDNLEITAESRNGKVGICYVEIGFEEPFESEQMANVRLITAAPDLLDALQELLAMEVKGHPLETRLHFSDKGRALYQKARSAINKALGENL